MSSAIVGSGGNRRWCPKPVPAGSGRSVDTRTLRLAYLTHPLLQGPPVAAHTRSSLAQDL
jgi:hypothetical protein